MAKQRPESANLRAELTRANMTQREVADLLGTYQSDVSNRLMTGRWRPGDLEKLADHLGVPVETIREDAEVTA